MRELLMFVLEGCPYCRMALAALEELRREEPGYRSVPVRLVDEEREADFADRFDYYAVPSLFLDGSKLFEARPGMSFVRIRAELRRALDTAAEEN